MVNSKYAAISIGAMLMSQVYAGGPSSGGHYNPAVTLGAFARLALGGGKAARLTAAKAAVYVLVQLAAGLSAGGPAG